jgi:hypothetical protein
MITLGTYHLNTRALLARLIYRWWWIAGLVTLLCVVGGLLRSGAMTRLTHGSGTLGIDAPAGAAVLLDGAPYRSATVAAGTHTVWATLPDGRTSWQTVTVAADTVITATLDAGLRPLTSRALLPAGPAAQLGPVTWANGAWRVPSLTRTAASPAPDGSAAYRIDTSAVTTAASTPLTTLNAFNGLADEVTRGAETATASYRALTGGSSVGGLEISTGLGEGATVPISSTLRWVQWAPDGAALLWSEQVTPVAEQLRLWTPRAPVRTLVAVPGQVEDVRWQPGGDGALVISNDGQTAALTLLRLRPAIESRVVATLPIRVADGQPPAGYGLRIPVAWTGTQVRWIAPDGAGAMRLWTAALAAGLPEVGPPLTALALHADADGMLRLVQATGDGVAIVHRRADGTLLGVGRVPDVPVLAGLTGQWSPDGGSLVLQAGARAWLVTTPSWTTGGRDG